MMTVPILGKAKKVPNHHPNQELPDVFGGPWALFRPGFAPPELVTNLPFKIGKFVSSMGTLQDPTDGKVRWYHISGHVL